MEDWCSDRDRETDRVKGSVEVPSGRWRCQQSANPEVNESSQKVYVWQKRHEFASDSVPFTDYPLQTPVERILSTA